jgi:hypothetical protein
VLVNSLILQHIPEINQLIRRKNLTHGFSGSTPWSLDVIAFGPVVRQNIMAVAQNIGSYSPHGVQETKEGTRISLSLSRADHQ